MTYSESSAQAAYDMWTKRNMSAHAIRAALERQHPRPDGWDLFDVHRAINQRAREVEERVLAEREWRSDIEAASHGWAPDVLEVDSWDSPRASGS